MHQEFNKYWIQNQKSAYEMVKEFVDEQGIKLKENNMEDRNKTVAELIADLQNQLDRANNRIEGLVKKNDELKEVNTTQFKNLHDIRLKYNGLYNKFHALDIEHAALVGKYCDYNKAAQDAWNENNKLRSMLKDYQIKYDKEKEKHQRATEKITHLKDALETEKAKNSALKTAIKTALKTAINSVYGSGRRYDNIDSQLYSFWRLDEYYHDKKDKHNKNGMKHEKDYGWFQYGSLDDWKLW